MRTPRVFLLLVLPFVCAAQPRDAGATGQGAASRITVNGRKLSARDLALVASLERSSGRQAIPGDYWYDNATGALGKWGGPTLTFLEPGLGLGGPLPANASGGGNGLLSGVFINGRELHPLDVQAIAALIRAPVMPGRWWVDAQGNAGLEGGPMAFNLFFLARQHSGGGGSAYYRSHGNGDSTSISNGCAAIHGSSGSGDSKSSYSYFVGCE